MNAEVATISPQALGEAWEKWVIEVIYKGNVKPGFIFPAEGSHYAAFKAGWDAARRTRTISRTSARG